MDILETRTDKSKNAFALKNYFICSSNKNVNLELTTFFSNSDHLSTTSNVKYFSVYNTN